MKRKDRTVSYKCPICLEKNINSEIRRQKDDLFFCSGCGSRLNERQIEDRPTVCHDLRIANISVGERNKRLKSVSKKSWQACGV